jgi:hypothetical protein
VAVVANPAGLPRVLTLAAAGAGALVCAAPTLLVLASFVGLLPFDMNMLFVALPALAAAVALALLGRGALGDLLLARPVLSADHNGVFDRRTMERPVPWSEVTRATSIVAGGGGVVLELRTPIPTGAMGTLTFEAPAAGAAHIILRGMTVPARQLAREILGLAAAAGVETADANAHEKVPRRTWSI